MDALEALEALEAHLGDGGVASILVTGPTASGKTRSCRLAAGAVGSVVRMIDLLDAQSPAGALLNSQQQSDESNMTGRLDRFVIAEKKSKSKREVLLVEDVDAALLVLPRAHVAAMLASAISGAAKMGGCIIMTSTDPNPLSSSKALKDLRVDAVVHIPPHLGPSALPERDRDARGDFLASARPDLALDLVMLESLGSLPYPPWDDAQE